MGVNSKGSQSNWVGCPQLKLVGRVEEEHVTPLWSHVAAAAVSLNPVSPLQAKKNMAAAQ